MRKIAVNINSTKKNDKKEKNQKKHSSNAKNRNKQKKWQKIVNLCAWFYCQKTGKWWFLSIQSKLEFKYFVAFIVFVCFFDFCVCVCVCVCIFIIFFSFFLKLISCLHVVFHLQKVALFCSIFSLCICLFICVCGLLCCYFFLLILFYFEWLFWNMLETKHKHENCGIHNDRVWTASYIFSTQKNWTLCHLFY